MKAFNIWYTSPVDCLLYVLQLNSRHWLISNASMTIELTSLCKAVVLLKMSELDLAICMVYIENKTEPQWRKQNWRKKGLGTNQLKAVFLLVFFFVYNTDLACAGEICGYLTKPPNFTCQTSVDVPKWLESSLHWVMFRNSQSLFTVCGKTLFVIKVFIMWQCQFCIK